MNANIKVVLFDIGGVIIRTDDPGPRERLARCFDLDRQGLDRLVFQNPLAQAAERGEKPEEAVWEYVRDRLSLSPAEMGPFRSEFWAGDSLDRSMLELLAHLRPHYRTGLLTNSWLRDPLVLFWDRFHLPEAEVRAALDGVISSAAIGVQKPGPRIFAAALELFGALAEETIFVDDFPHNVEAARGLGFEAILFESPTQARRDLLALLDR
jgi:HAD superfamily hydrolase (TIGR01509 family)